MASIAAGRGGYQTPDSPAWRRAPTLYDVRVLDERGIGTMADLLVGIDWVLQRARFHNIRVMNLSLARQRRTDSFLLDPLARAARSAAAAGIVVVASASNAGKNEAGAEVYGAIGSPGIEPSIITVGAANSKATAIAQRRRGDRLQLARSDPRQPGAAQRQALGRQRAQARPRGAGQPAARRRWPTRRTSRRPPATLLATLYPSLMQGAQAQGAAQAANEELMQLSGTSVAAPAVAGAAAVLLQANPGLTPPLVKAILQYTAQPMPGANLLQQGAGQLNVEGAVRLAQALRTDIGQRVGQRHAEGGR